MTAAPLDRALREAPAAFPRSVPKTSPSTPTNENTNCLLRRYLPKRTDLTVHSQADLNPIAHSFATTSPSNG